VHNHYINSHHCQALPAVLLVPLGQQNPAPPVGRGGERGRRKRKVGRQGDREVRQHINRLLHPSIRGFRNQVKHMSTQQSIYALLHGKHLIAHNMPSPLCPPIRATMATATK